MNRSADNKLATYYRGCSRSEADVLQHYTDYPHFTDERAYWEAIKKKLGILSARNSTSKDDVLRLLAAPIRLEFLTALAIKSRLPHVRVIPNYTADDTGLPTSTAGSGVGDIECLETLKGIFVEVTMAEGRAQTMMEVWPIWRHLTDFKEKYTKDADCIFVAPTLFFDSLAQIQWLYDKTEGKDRIRPYNIDDFVCSLESTDHLYANRT